MILCSCDKRLHGPRVEFFRQNLFLFIFFPLLGVSSWLVGKYLHLYYCKLLYHCSHQVMIRIGRTDHNATLSGCGFASRICGDVFRYAHIRLKDDKRL